MAEADLTKRCTACGSQKPLSAFHKQRLGKHGREARCKACKLEYENRKRAERRAAKAPPEGMKRCAKCQQMKPLDAFQVESRRKDGRTARCRECLSVARRAHRSTEKGRRVHAESNKRYSQTESGRVSLRRRVRKWRQSEQGQQWQRSYEQRPEKRVVRAKYRRSERAKIVRKKWKNSEHGRQVLSRLMRSYRERNREKELARRYTNLAVRRGALPRPDSLDCVRCGGKAAEYHHHKGYDRESWLDVVAVCTTCHDVLG